MEFDFEKEMDDLHVSGPQMDELRVAYRQTAEGFELAFARAKGADVPRAALLSAIRRGSHLRAAGIREDERKKTLFECKVCGVLGNTNSENHYSNFPEHREGRHIPPTNITLPPKVERRDGTVRSKDEVAT